MVSRPTSLTGPVSPPRSNAPRTANTRVKRRPPTARLTRHGTRAVIGVPAWMIRGYREANAGDLAAAIAYNALVALVPTFLLLVAIAGLFLRDGKVLETAVHASLWALPPDAARDALKTVLDARRYSGIFGIASLIGFAWVGTNFVSSLARSMNRVYGVRGCGFKCERRRSFVVIFLFAAFFLMASLAATVPTLFIGRHLGTYFETWRLAAAQAQVVSYGIAILAALALFVVIYRIVPNAGQKLADVWPGALTAATLFVVMAQAFPLYLRFFSNDNRFGQLFGLMSLLITWFYALAHVLLFGTYVNATYFKRRHKRPHLNPNATKA